MATRTIMIDHNGRTLYGHVATIESTFLGYEHHGIFTAGLHLKWDSSGVKFGDYCLDDVPGDDEKRHGTAFGMDHIIEIMRTVGVGTWEALKGKRVIVLFDTESGWGSMVQGIANIDDDDRVFIPKDHAEAWKARTA